ncbi:PREDICTED: vinorine synthase-like [Fragaria vesca subsp. vesca]|uniref:vinorine synthase-like n=1 Tax=Fragaria vesca subsp. vesca TaxID=101020 RepID=UPI0002C32FFE|nr:PREDICTED: vinorine synthase-like [Fragaria vesca subsp. vesca]
MSAQMKIEIIERQIIKPSSPTPHHLRNFELSFFDQMAITIYTPLLLFFPNTESTSKLEICEHLTESLAKTLTHFYPLAGRIKGSTVVECNDDGAEFVKAQVSCSLSDFLENPAVKILEQFLPAEILSKEAGSGPLLLVQVSLFECGGMALGFSISHKIADASTLSTFINCWAQTTNTSITDSEVTLPEFGSASLFPPLEKSSDSSQPPARVYSKNHINITRRFVFDGANISALQSKVASPSVPKPTRVEAISALIWKCAIEASTSKSGSQRPSVFSQDVNLRKRVVPPLPENCAGNVVGFFRSKVEVEDGTSVAIDLKDLVSKFREGIENYAAITETIFGSDEAWQGIKDKYKNLKKSDAMGFYSCTSWCRFPFYEADFGWGKPNWVSIASVSIENIIVMLDKRDGNGIEVWLTMNHETMALFESNAELLAYASVNPSVT